MKVNLEQYFGKPLETPETPRLTTTNEVAMYLVKRLSARPDAVKWKFLIEKLAKFDRPMNRACSLETLEIGNLSLLIDCLCSWAGTVEGGAYWSDIYEKFKAEERNKRP
jgi:hypothetical protein